MDVLPPIFAKTICKLGRCPALRSRREEHLDYQFALIDGVVLSPDSQPFQNNYGSWRISF